MSAQPSVQAVTKPVRWAMRVFIASGVTILSGNPSSAQNAFDGVWHARAISETGTCRSDRQHVVRIRNGRAFDRTSRTYEVKGGLDAAGRIDGSVRIRNTTIIVRGSVAGNSASGTWSSTGRRACSGRWEAAR